MAHTAIGHQVRVSAVDKEADFETRVNVKKRREYIRYRTLTNQNHVNIAYLLGQQVTPSNNLFVSDRSTVLTQNRVPTTLDLIIETTDTLNLSVDQFVVTDRFTTETATKPEVPLFYVHRLKNFNDELPDFANRTILSFEFADADLRTRSLTDYVFDSSSGLVYNNIENYFSDATFDYDVTFIKYTVRVVDGSTQTIEIHHELIDNGSIYEIADFDDLDEDFQLLSTVKKYLVEEQPGGSRFIIHLPVEQRYAYKELPTSRIKLLPPTAVDVKLPWYVRVTNGKFLTSLPKTQSTSEIYKYSIKEFMAQGFNPFPPYKSQPDQGATWINENLLRVPKNIASNVGLGLFIEVFVKDKARTPKYAYTDNPSKVGVLFLDDVSFTAGILSIDSQHGFIEVTGPIRDDDIVTVSYYTEEDEYELTSVDLNPIDNIDILGQRMAVYAVPESSSTGELDESLHYLIINTLGEIVYSSQATNSANAIDFPTIKLVAEDFWPDGSARHTMYYDKQSTVSGLLSRNSDTDQDAIDELSFIDKYTAESILLDAQTTVSGNMVLNFQDNPKFLVLGDVYVGEGFSPDELTTLDMRVQGGGIKDGSLEDALEDNAEVMWYWDQMAQKTYPSGGAFYMEVPQSLLTTLGGRFTREQIVDIVGRHMRGGGYAVVNTYGIDPVVTAYSVTSGSISIDWPTYGSGVQYNVYYGLSLDSVTTQANSALLDDDENGNDYTLSGLVAATKHFVRLDAVDEDGYESPSSIYAITTAYAE